MTVTPTHVRTPRGPVCVTGDPVTGTHFALVPRMVRYRTIDGGYTDEHFAGGFRLVHRPSGSVVVIPGWPMSDLDDAEHLDVLRGLAVALEGAPGIDWASSRPLDSAEASNAALAAVEAALGCTGDMGRGWLR